MPDCRSSVLRGAAVTTVEGLGSADKPGRAAAGIHRRAGGAVRLLHRRHDHAGAGAAGEQRRRPTTPRSGAHMAPNLCRCGTHMRILRAVRRAADALKQAAAGMSAREAGADPGRRRFLARRRAGRQLRRHRRRRRSRRGAGAASCPAASGPQPMLDALDPHRRRRPHHRLHRQGRARPGHQDRADPGRRRRAGGRAGAAITLVTADTARTPNEGYTAGSHSMQDSGTAILHAAAQVRATLLDLAAVRLAHAACRPLGIADGVISAGDRRRRLRRAGAGR